MAVIRKLIMAQLQSIVLEADPKDGWLTCKLSCKCDFGYKQFWELDLGGETGGKETTGET